MFVSKESIFETYGEDFLRTDGHYILEVRTTKGIYHLTKNTITDLNNISGIVSTTINY